MKTSMTKRILVILLLAFAIWALCGATMSVGRAITTLENTLIIHAIGAPIFAALVSLIYFKKFNYTTPAQTAFIFLSFVIIADAGLVAPVFEKSYEMFKSALGTWIPFALIFLSTYAIGLLVKKGNA